MTFEKLSLLPTHRLQAYYDKHLHVNNKLPNATMHEHLCNGKNCGTCEQINDLHTLAYAVKEELGKRPFHKRLKKRHHIKYDSDY